MHETENLDVNFLCEFNATGIGRHCENAFFGVLRQRRAGLIPYYVNQSQELSLLRWRAEARNRGATTLLFGPCPTEVLRTLPGRKIGWLFFESDALPPKWVERMRALDQLWMPSEWGRQVLLAHGLEDDRIRVVTAGVDPEIYRPEPVPHAKFTFLFVGKCERRKSLEESIEAFLAEFPSAMYPDIVFRAKAEHALFPDRVASLRARYARDVRVEIVCGSLSDEQMAALYNAADAFVCPTKAEGFGLPCVEALACGLPVITTYCSAQQTFLEAIKGLYYEVSFDVSEIDDPDFAHFYGPAYEGAPFGRWALPRIASIRAGMRDIYQNRGVWRTRAVEASALIRRSFSWDAVGRAAVDVLLQRRSPATT